MIAKLLRPRAEDRLPLKKILEHPWVLQHLSDEVRSKYVICKLCYFDDYLTCQFFY